jgi:hypothetical protein
LGLPGLFSNAERRFEDFDGPRRTPRGGHGSWSTRSGVKGGPAHVETFVPRDLHVLIQPGVGDQDLPSGGSRARLGGGIVWCRGLRWARSAGPRVLVLFSLPIPGLGGPLAPRPRTTLSLFVAPFPFPGASPLIILGGRRFPFGVGTGPLQRRLFGLGRSVVVLDLLHPDGRWWGSGCCSTRGPPASWLLHPLSTGTGVFLIR